jgi:hypothetical protein
MNRREIPGSNITPGVVWSVCRGQWITSRALSWTPFIVTTWAIAGVVAAVGRIRQRHRATVIHAAGMYNAHLLRLG